MADSGPFALNEKVLVPHTDKFYEAKVLKAAKREDGLWYYLLHYTGWNKKWDEWVEETGLRRAPASGSSSKSQPAAAPPPTAAADAAGPRSSSAAAAAAAGGGPPAGGAAAGIGGSAAAAAAAATAAAAGAAVPGRKQAKNGLTVQRQRKPGDPAGPEPAEVQLALELPAALQKQLLDQYDAMHDEGRTVALPRRPNVAQILQGYVAYVREKQGESAAEEDIVMGLQVYFDKALYQCLLYRPERQQAQQALAAGQAPSAVYGAEHLLRLFVKLPELLPPTGAPEEQLQLLLQRMEDVLVYLQHQAAKIFAPLSEYVPFSSFVAGPAAGVGLQGGAWGHPASKQQQQQAMR
uniref:Uncharacterized protein n=1 Tax=Tetradesmus obliquus TaxID=3088 RepID=A0A383VIF0_TETOB|eukprot:jgi/Sobl393_1/10894/SZX65295.1